MINATFRPIEAWPDELLTSYRVPSPFTATWERTLQLLDHELRMHGAKAVVIKLALTDEDIRRDGWPRAKAQPQHPGVILEYEDPAEGWTTFHADKYDDWRHNVRAVAQTLQDLRRIERNGAAHGRQYIGFRREIEAGARRIPGALTTNGTARAPYYSASTATARASRLPMKPSEALDFFEEHGDVDLTNVERPALEHAYRRAAKRLHPDQGGDPELFARLQEARDLLLPSRGESPGGRRQQG